MLFYIQNLFKNLKEKNTFKQIDIKTAKASLIGGLLTIFLFGGLYAFLLSSLAEVDGWGFFLMAALYFGCLIAIGDSTRDSIKYYRSLIDPYLQENEKELIQSFKIKWWHRLLSGFLAGIGWIYLLVIMV